MQKEFLAARRAGVPAIQITTPDPASTMRKIVSWLPKGSPVFNWNPVNGLLPHEKNPHAIQFMEVIVGENQESTVSPVEALRLARKLPSGVNADPNLRAVLFMQGLNSMLTDAQVIQAIWNLRDPYKSNGRMLILVGPEADLPAELASDFLGLTDPLPDKTELEGIIRAIYEPYNMTPPADVLEKAVDATLGLPAFPAEQCVAMSVGKNGALDMDLLWKRKEQEIDRVPGLKVIHTPETLNDVQGCSNVKTYLGRYLAGKAAPRLIVFIDEIEKQMSGSSSQMGDSSGTSQDQLGVLLSEMQDCGYKGMMYIGPPGCLAGDTPMLYNRGARNSGRILTLEKLYRKFNGLQINGGRGECIPWRSNAKTRLHSFNYETGEVFYNNVVSIRSSGEKECIGLQLAGGECLTLTPDHPVLTPDGFVMAGSLFPGDKVIKRGSMKPSKTTSPSVKAERMIVTALKYYKSGMLGNIVDNKTGVLYEYRRQTRARLVLEADMNGLPYELYVWLLKNDPSAVNLLTLPEDIEVHHKNHNSMDDRLENLEILTKSQHTLAHDPVSRFGVEYSVIDTVMWTFDAGRHQTYDIQMESPANNFSTADGLFVHNSAKSMVAKAAGNAGKVPCIQLDLGGMKSKFVGESEGRIRAAFRTIHAISQGRALFIATCNSIGVLPPELRRRFTLGTFFFDLPDAAARKSLWKFYRDRYQIPSDDIIPMDEGWTGDEVKRCCEIADMLGMKLAEASSFIVPVSKSMGKQLEKLRIQCSGAFIDAAKPGIYIYEPPKQDAGRFMDMNDN